MNILNPIAALSLTAVTLSSVGVFAQANVAENQSTVLTVDARSGSDVSAGISQPLKTLQAAVDKALVNNSHGIGTRVLINPGVYRETLKFNASNGQTAAPITIEAVQTGAVTISGSDLLTHWFQGSVNRSIYTHAWNYNLGICAVPSGWPSGIQPIVRHREMLFVNNVALTQVLSSSQMRSGTFFVDQSSHVVHAWPASGTNMTTAKVEIAVRPEVLNVSGRNNIVFRGLVLQHAASCINHNGANVNSSTNVLFDSVQVKWNNWGGLGINSSNGITVKNSVASHNGGVGFTGFHSRNALYEFDESDFNNWRGAMGGLYDWGMAGAKFMGMHTATVTNFYAYRNQAQGLWFDTDNKNITISNVHIAESTLANLQLEANEGPVSLTNSTFCSGGIGVIAVNTEHITATGNIFYNNGNTSGNGAQFYLAGNPGGRHITDWETHQSYLLYTSHMILKNNVFQDSGAGQRAFGTFLSGNDWNQFAWNLTGSGNRWYDPTSTRKFVLPSNKQTDLRGWQSATRTDYASSWGSVAQLAAACKIPGH